MTDNASVALHVAGRKVFFLYPPSVIQDDVLSTLIRAGYEAYTLRDHTRAYQLLARFDGSILFINIDQGLEEQQWEIYIREVLNNPKTQSSRLGVLSYNSDPVMREKYQADMGLPCGYVQLKLDIKASTGILLNALETAGARGRRRHIRADCEDEGNAAINIKKEGFSFTGQLVNISSAGAAARFDKPVAFEDNEKLTDVQLRLWGTPIIVPQAAVMGICKGQSNVWVFLFETGLRDEDKETIHNFIRHCLHHYMENLEL
ncbi:hypothetical protein FACS189485_15020 [Spirochaetia bacterium]|nr:hypothetical protein FACS189485_15020 [Spirochaetia bacterium]